MTSEERRPRPSTLLAEAQEHQKRVADLDANDKFTARRSRRCNGKINRPRRAGAGRCPFDR